MLIFYLTIPLMLVAVGLALAPLVWAMKRQLESEARIATISGTRRTTHRRAAGIGPVVNEAHAHNEIGGMAA